MEISECFLLPKYCNHLKACLGPTCRLIGSQKCVHAVIHEGNLKVMHGKDLYKLLDKDHPQYQHLYKLYDEEYLNTLRLEAIEQGKIDRIKYQEQLKIEKKNKEQAIKDREEYYLRQAGMTSEMKIRRTPV